MIESNLRKHIEEWCRDRPIRLCVAFGSRARGEARPESDLDIAIWAEYDPDADQRLDWLSELQEPGLPEIQLVVVTADLDPVLAMQIAREGTLIFENARDTWTTSRVRLWQTYQDAAPFLEAARASLRRYVEEIRDGS